MKSRKQTEFQIHELENKDSNNLNTVLRMFSLEIWGGFMKLEDIEKSEIKILDN